MNFFSKLFSNNSHKDDKNENIKYIYKYTDILINDIIDLDRINLPTDDSTKVEFPYDYVIKYNDYIYEQEGLYINTEVLENKLKKILYNSIYEERVPIVLKYLENNFSKDIKNIKLNNNHFLNIKKKLKENGYYIKKQKLDNLVEKAKTILFEKMFLEQGDFNPQKADLDEWISEFIHVYSTNKVTVYLNYFRKIYLKYNPPAYDYNAITIYDLEDKIDEYIKKENKRKQYNKMKVLVRRFIENYITSTYLQLPKYQISEKDLSVLHEILNDREYQINMEKLHQIIEEQKIYLYQEEFLKRSELDIKDKDINSWIKAYIEVFNNNIDKEHIEYVRNIYINLHPPEEAHQIITNKEFEIKIKEAINEKLNNAKAKKRKKRIKNALDGIKEKHNSIRIDEIDKMNGYQFELFLKDLFDRKGFNTEITSKSGDQGADIIAKKYADKKVIQAKRYKSLVNNKAIQEVVGSKKYYNASTALVITNNYFTSSAKELAKANNVELWNRNRLKKELEYYNS